MNLSVEYIKGKLSVHTLILNLFIRQKKNYIGSKKDKKL